MTDTRTGTHDEVLKPAGEAEEIDDEIISEMTKGLRREGGGERGDDERGDDEERGDQRDAPFNLGMPPPRAIDLRRLWKLAGKKPDDSISAALGPRVPVLLSHGVTAFPRPGRKPARVWGLGYTVQMFDVDARTIDVQPTTELLDVATVGSQANVEIGLDGKLEVPEGAQAALSTIPGVNLTAAKIGASTDQSAKLSISFTISVPKVISGPGDGPGGAEWNLYAQDKRLEGHQALLQTVLLPKGVKRLRMGVTGWVREAGIFGPKQWIFETATFDVDLER